MTLQEFLRKSLELNGRIVSSGDLHTEVIVEARANDKFYVDPETSLGWAIVPWTLSTMKDREREKEIVMKKIFAAIDAMKKEADAEMFSTEDSPNRGAVLVLERLEDEIAA